MKIRFEFSKEEEAQLTRLRNWGACTREEFMTKVERRAVQLLKDEVDIRILHNIDKK